MNADLDLALPRLIPPPQSAMELGVSLRGHIEVFDEISGIAGWVIDKSDLSAIVSIDLCLGSHVVASTQTSVIRDDLSALVGERVAPGFNFGPAAMRILAEQATAYPNTILQVRIAGTQLSLNAPAALPTANRVARLIAASDARNAVDRKLSLHALLLRLAERASDLLVHPLRPIPENVQGVIEMITVNPAGNVWFIGWMNKGYFLEFSGIIADRGKIPCGIALLSYDRPDLKKCSCGVVGVIASEWHPNTLSNEFTIFFGKDARLCLRVHQPLRVVSATEFIAEFDCIRATCRNDRRGPAIVRLLNELEHWSQTNAASHGFVAYASVDQLLLVPGFGYFVEGWIISPAKRIDHLELRIQDKTLRCATETLYHKPRPDLLDAYPSHSVLAQSAGFVACFFGDATSEDVSEPTLRIVFEDGSTWNQPIAPEIVRQLGHSAKLAALRMFYPTIEDEPFFVRLATNLMPPAISAPLRPHAVAPFATVAIFMVPNDRCDVVLLFDDIAGRATGDGIGYGVAFVAPSTAARPDVVRLFGDLTRAMPNRASLFFASEGTQPLDTILPVLEATHAKRFLFAGPAVFLSDLGWQGVMEAFSRPIGLEIFEIMTECWQSEHTANTPSSLCFAWSADALAQWRDSAPRVLGGFYRDNGLLTRQTDVIWHRGVARLTRPLHITPLEEALNSVLLESANA